MAAVKKKITAAGPEKFEVQGSKFKVCWMPRNFS
jgi:hypothetical protein